MEALPVPLKLFTVVMGTLIVVLGLCLFGLSRLNKQVDESDPG
jgi:hypothetical protein